MLEIKTVDGVQTWTMNFAPVNALDPPFLDALEAAVDEALADESVSVIVITSGLRVFSAGADAAWMGRVVREHGAQRLLEDFNRTMDRFRDVCIRIRRSNLLFIAALNGHTLAGGLELAAACDLRFAADHDRIQIGASEMKLFGVLPSGGGGSQFIARLMGPARALDFLLEAENYSPTQALQSGLVERLYPADELVGAAQEFGARVAGRAGRIGINAAKRSILDGTSLPVYEGLELDRVVHWDSMRRGGFLPGVTAFVEQFGGGL
jgi:enoyl-CoA hydratase/carnithine racemase